MAAFNRGDMDEYIQHFDPSALRWIDGFEQPLGVSAIKESLDQLRSGFERLRLNEDLLFGTERFVCARWRLCGTQVSNFMGIAPGKRTIDVPTCEIYEVEGATVISTWVYGDPGQIFRQIADPVENGSMP